MRGATLRLRGKPDGGRKPRWRQSRRRAGRWGRLETTRCRALLALEKVSEELAKIRSRPGVAEQRKRILAAARQLLSEGVDAEITAKDLADRAGVSRATFYRCFDNVESVIDILYNEFLDRVTRRLENHIQTGSDPAGWLRHLIGEVLGDAAEMGPYLVALYREELRPGSPACNAQAQRIEAQIDQICGWWQSWSSIPVDRSIVRSIILLAQAAGISLARNDVPSEERARFESAVMFMIEATIERYLRSAQGG